MALASVTCWAPTPPFTLSISNMIDEQKYSNALTGDYSYHSSLATQGKEQMVVPIILFWPYCFNALFPSQTHEIRGQGCLDSLKRKRKRDYLLFWMTS